MIGLCWKSGTDISFHKNDDLSSLQRLCCDKKIFIFLSSMSIEKIFDIEGEQSATSLSLWSRTSQKPNTGVKITEENNSF